MDERIIHASIQRKTISERWPYKSGDQKDFEQYFEQIADAVDESPVFEAIRVPRFLEAKYASFSKVICVKSERRSEHKVKDAILVSGLALYVSKAAPVAVWGCGGRNFTSAGSFDSEIAQSVVYEPPKIGEWQAEVEALNDIISKFELLLPSKKVLERELTEKLPFNSLFAYEKETVFDALFHIEY